MIELERPSKIEAITKCKRDLIKNIAKKTRHMVKRAKEKRRFKPNILTSLCTRTSWVTKPTTPNIVKSIDI